jgi:hypothetical protein
MHYYRLTLLLDFSENRGFPGPHLNLTHHCQNFVLVHCCAEKSPTLQKSSNQVFEFFVLSKCGF